MRLVHAAFCLPLLIAPLPAAAQDLPPRKPGLWEMSVATIIQSQTAVPQVSQHCIDGATDKAMRTLFVGMTRAKCERQDWRREGTGLVLYAGCRVGEQPISLYGVATGNLAEDYTSTLTIKRLGTPAGITMPPEQTITTKARWVGACKANQRPGDMVLPDGTLMNIRGVPGMAELLPAPASMAASAPASPQLPPRKVGLWEIRSRFDRDVLPPQSQQVCLDAELDREMNALSGLTPGASCTQSVGREGAKYVLTGTCVDPALTLNARAVIAGDFQSAFEAKITLTRQDGLPIAPGLPTELVARQEQRWLAACSADMRPGDMIAPDGSKKNFRDMRRAGR